jgi:hypothetical protein
MEASWSDGYTRTLQAARRAATTLARPSRSRVASVPMMKIHETVGAEGELRPIFLAVDAGIATLVDDDGTLPLPEGAIDAVMVRYAAPLEADVKLIEVAALDLGGGRRVRHVRHLARYDVIARDWLLYEAEGREPVGALATTVAGALGHLARAMRAAEPLSGS